MSLLRKSERKLQLVVVVDKESLDNEVDSVAEVAHVLLVRSQSLTQRLSVFVA
jgi:hypothetical protein